MNMRHGIGVMAIVLLNGCATKALTVSEADKYKDMDVRSFIKLRFGESEGMSGVATFVAHYNGVNADQLLRPTRELSSLCAAQGGKFTRTSKYTGNPVSRVFNAPGTAALNAFIASAISTDNPELASEAGRRAWASQQNINATYDGKGAMEGFAAANAQVNYGAFECRAKGHDGPGGMWSAKIIPTGFLPKEAQNDLSAHRLVIAIIGM